MPYDKNNYEEGRGKFWRQSSDNPKAPVYRGDVKIPKGWEGKVMQISVWHNPEHTNKDGFTSKEHWGIHLTEPWEGESKSDFKPKYHVAPERREQKDDIPF
jgi:hypothetical protein